jgi:NTE family protein
MLFFAAFDGAAQLLPFYADDAILSVTRPIIRGGGHFEQRIAELNAKSGGESFGLVLSGGSARAFAHIGVLQVMEQESIRPDFIVADSMGAIVALLYCAGIAPDDIAGIFDVFPANRYFDPELPLFGGFLDAGRFIAVIRALVGNLDLADMPIPVLIVCEDLVSRRQVLLAEGDAATVMAAAIALPAVFEPVRMGDLLLIDGGVTNLVPVDIACRYSTRVAVATALYGRKMNFASPFVVINRAIDIGKTRSSVAGILEHEPLVIRCDVEELSYMQFSRPAEVIARGRSSTLAVLEELRALSGESRAPSGELAERRAYFKRRIEKMTAAARLGAAFPVPPDVLVGTDIRLFDEAKNGSAVFSGRRWAGPSIEVRGGPLHLRLSAVAGLEDDDDRAWGLVLRAGLDKYIFPSCDKKISGFGCSIGVDMLVSGSGVLTDGIEPPAPQDIALSSAASISFEPLDGLIARPLIRGELGLPVRAGDASWGLAAGLDLAAPRTSTAVSGAGADLEGLFAFDSDGNRGPAVSLELQWTWADSLALRARGIYRQAFEGPGLKAVVSDPCRSAPVEERGRMRFFSNLEAMWTARPLEMAFGELVIIERPELGVYVDVSGVQTETNGLTTLTTVGGTLSAGVSIMGLAPMSFSLFGGAAVDGSGLIVGLRAGRFFE